MTGYTNAPPLSKDEIKQISMDLVEAAGELENTRADDEPQIITKARNDLAKRIRDHADRMGELLTGKRIIS